MLKTQILAIFLGVALVACTDNSSGEYQRMLNESAPMATSDVKMQAGAGFLEKDTLSSPPPPGSDQSNPSAQSFLAYRYFLGYSLPSENVASTAKAHANQCLQAGADKCQILSSSQSSQSKDYVSAQLQIRAEPEWLKSFRQDIESSVEAAKGKQINERTTAEDLTRAILDTDARLKAKKTLRIRLEGLLETRDAKLPDLLALERELARVQAEIESATTQLNVLRKRVSMSVVDINYESKSVAVSRGRFYPVKRALTEFFGTMSESLAGVIYVFAAILPWFLLIIPTWYLIRFLWRRRKAAKAGPSKTKKAKQAANSA